MAITPSAGYMIDPNNPNAVVPTGSTAEAQQLGVYSTPTTTAPAPTPTSTPTTSTPPAAVTQSTTTPDGAKTTTKVESAAPQQAPLAMPANGSVVDLLNMAGQDSSQAARTALAQQYGIQGYDFSATKNQELAQKFLDAYNKNKGTATPQSGMDAKTQAFPQGDQNSAPQNVEEIQATAFDQYMKMNPVMKTIYDQITQALSTTNTSVSLADEYKKAFSDVNNPAGTPGESLSDEQLKYMNIKRIMDGTEDDIRNEITKAGGFATESQVAAIAGARNKVLLKQAQQIQDSMNLKQDYVDHLLDFSQKDRDQIGKDLDRKLNLEGKLMDIQDKMTNAATENYKNIINKNGFQGLYAGLNGNPTAIAAAEKALGLPAGGLAKESMLEATALADRNRQFVPATANQAAGYWDPATKTFTPLGGGRGGSGGSNTVTSNPALSTALSTIKNSLASPTKAQLAQIDQIANSSDPFAAIKNQAQNIMGQTKATQVVSYEQAQSAMKDLTSELDKYYAAKGSTDIFSGTYEQALAKLGDVNDPTLREIATEIEASLQVYRNAVSGTAYSVQEGQAIASIFPSISNTKGLNDAVISGRMKVFDSVIDSAYESVLGKDTYQALKSSYGTKYTPGSIIVSNGVKYQVGEDGQTIAPIGGQVDLSPGINLTNNNPIFGSGKSFF